MKLTELVNGGTPRAVGNQDALAFHRTQDDVQYQRDETRKAYARRILLRLRDITLPENSVYWDRFESEKLLRGTLIYLQEKRLITYRLSEGVRVWSLTNTGKEAAQRSV